MLYLARRNLEDYEMKDTIIIVGDLNANVGKDITPGGLEDRHLVKEMNEFCQESNLTSLVRDSSNPTAICIHEYLPKTNKETLPETT